jgi:hypothetical protein
MIAFIVVLVISAAFAFAAQRWGVDSREDSPDPRRPEYPVGIE